MTELLTFIGRTWEGSTLVETRRDVLCSLRSVGHAEFYEANATDFHPELKFVLADYLDYNRETFALHNGTLYKVLRTYRKGQELELTVESAPAEEVIADE